MFDYNLFSVKSPDGSYRVERFFGIWGVINEINEGDSSKIPDSQFLEWAERLQRGAAVNYRGYIIRRLSVVA